MTLVALALAVDSPRTYLSPQMQDSGATSSDFSPTMAVTALSAASAGIAGSILVRRGGTHRLLLVGFGLALTGLACWAVRQQMWWVVGAWGSEPGPPWRPRRSPHD